MAITAQTRTELIQLVVSMLGEAPSTAMLTDLVTKANAGSTIQELADSLATDAAFTSQFPIWMTATEFTTKVVANMFAGSSVSQADTDAAVDYIAGAITAGTFTKTSAVVALTSYLASADGVANATYGSAAQSYQNKVEVAEYYTITKGLGDSSAAERKAAIAGVTDAADSVTSSNAASDATATVVSAVPSTTLTLTTGVDALNGTAGNDTINAVVQANGLTGSTVSPGDTVVGGAGTDTFNLSVAGDGGGAGYTLQAVNLSGVEKVMVTNYDTNASNTTIDTSLMSGLETVGLFSSSATGDTVFGNMTAITDAQMSNGSADLTLTYIAGTTGTADTQNLAISATSAGTFNANGVETIAVTGSLSANKLTNIAGSALKKITISGDQNFTMSGSSSVATIDASANTGKTSLLIGANGVAGSTITLGAGDDTVDMGATLNALDKIQGGEGTDTIKISAAGTVNGGTAVVATSEFVQSGGFEVIDIASTNNAATLNVKDIAGVETIKAAANTKTITIASAANGADADVWSFTLNGTTYSAAAVTSAGNQAADEAEAAAAIATAADAIAGITATSTAAVVTITNTTGERLDISAVDDSIATDDGTATVSSFTNLTVSGMTNQALDIYTANDVTARLVDSSGTSDVMNINLKSILADRAAAQTINNIDIADSVETLNLSATGMKTGTAATQKTLTTLTADAALTTLNLTGSDKLDIGTTTTSKLASINAGTYTGDLGLPSVGSLAQTITTGSGNDTLTMGANLTATDVIDLGGNTVTAAGTMGKDIVTATGNQGTSVAAAALQLANVETFQLTKAQGSGAASTFIDGTNLASLSEIAISSDATGAFTFTNMPAGVALGAGIAADELDAAVTWTLADATGTADALTVDYADTLNAASSLALTTAGIETLNIVAEKAGSNTSTLVNTAMTAPTINITGGITTNVVALGTLNKATTTVTAGATKSVVNLTAATGVGMNVTAAGATANTMTLSTKADTVTLTGDLGTAIHVINGGATASAAASDTFNARINNAATDLTSVSGFEVLNLTLKDSTASGLNDGTKDDGFENASVVNILGGNANSSFTMAGTAILTRDKTSAALAQTIDASTTSAPMTLIFGSDDLDIQTTVKGGSSTSDNVSTIIAAGASATVGNNPTMSGIELLTVTSTDGDVDAVINLANVTGLGRVDATFDTLGAADQIEIDGLAAGVALRVAGTNAADNLDVGLASATGSADALSITSTANATGLNLDAAGIEALTLAQNVAATYDLAGVSPTTGATTTVTLAGSGNVALSALHTGINVIDGSAMGGTLTVQAAARDTDLYTIKGGVNSDVIAMENSGDILSGGSQPAGGGDTLEVTLAAILGGITVDLSAADQVVSMDGGVNAAVQSGFESIDLSGFTGFGSVITGTDGANTITGTALADRINAGKGNDTIKIDTGTVANSDQMNGGAGTDTLSIASGLTATIDGDGDISAVENIVFEGAGVAVMTGQTEGFAVTTAVNTDVDNDFTGGSGNDTFTSSNALDTDELIHTGSSTTGGVDTYAGFTVGANLDLINLPATVSTSTAYLEVTSAPTLDSSATGVLILDYNVATAAADMTAAELYAAASGGGNTAGNAAENLVVAATTDATNAADVFVFVAVMNAGSNGFASIDHVVTITGITDTTAFDTTNWDVA